MGEMIYDQNGQTAGVRAAIQTFKDAQLSVRAEYDADMNERMAYYKGNQREITEDAIRELYPEVWEQMSPLVYANFYRKIIDAMCNVYTEQPTRKINKGKGKPASDKPDPDQELLDKIYNDCHFSRKIKILERYSAMFQSPLMQWRFDDDTGKLVFDLIEPQKVQVAQGDGEPNDLNKARALAVALQPKYDTLESERVERYQYWSAGKYPLGGKAQSFVFDAHGNVEPWPESYGNPDFENTYIDPVTDLPIYPLVKADWEEPVEFFDIGGDDVLAMCKALDHRTLDLMYGAKMQAFSLPVLVTGPTFDLPKKMTFDPGVIMHLTQQGDSPTSFNFASPDPRLQEILDIIKALVKLLGYLKNADPTALNLDGQGQPESGYSLYLQKGDCIKSRKDRLDYWRDYENEIFRKAAIVWNAHNPDEQFSAEAIEGGITVDFADPTPEMSPEQQIALDRMREEDGLISKVDRMLQYNPDLSREEAKARLKEIKAENEELNGVKDREKDMLDGFKTGIMGGINPKVKAMQDKAKEQPPEDKKGEQE